MRAAPLASLRSAPLAACALLALAGCKKTAPNPGGPLDRPILSVDLAAAAAQNAAALGASFTGPQPTSCAADTTRAFIAELTEHGISGAQVQFHWAPVVPGPIPGKGPDGQPALWASGTLVSTNHSALDTSFDHPFGWDFNANLLPDAPFATLADNRDAQNTDLHVELEMGLFPEGPFGFAPQAGDRAVFRGAWIWDCGHPPYETELHPPSLLSFARSPDAKSTSALAFAVPWRVTQTFGPAAAVLDFADPTRLRTRGKGFPAALYDAVVSAAVTNADHLEAHVLLEPLRFDPFTLSVCAPSPRPPNVSLKWTHRLTLRSGVSATQTVREAQGCVDYTFSMVVNYDPFVPTRIDFPWSWDEISAQASEQAGEPVDVRAEIIKAVQSGGLGNDLPALRADHPPVIDRYAPLAPKAGADLDAPTTVDAAADGQPFPFYGRMRVYWEE
jgi:hypothetical protein